MVLLLVTGKLVSIAWSLRPRRRVALNASNKGDAIVGIMDQLLNVDSASLAQIVVQTFLIYLALLAGVRLAGQRDLGQVEARFVALRNTKNLLSCATCTNSAEFVARRHTARLGYTLHTRS